jgi:hypothetical protein
LDSHGFTSQGLYSIGFAKNANALSPKIIIAEASIGKSKQ